ncbi:class I SAM-dependent methyltransferase [Nisaea acidiphila]|uniref:Class I SAM-dependent methyltransferase n=1 Tax=Nisaea acidiphila TaxID=1862145 RepID=A0A9J7AS79_9PROT|nr:class I SAM-dependent methyltransferase [Nisaea acidiphila]UUX50119.1 class I SAM-dependent methyltransferase [Nisaea acidiphila]
MDRFLEANRRKWNELAEVNFSSSNSDYDVGSFIEAPDGIEGLHKTEREELGSVEGLDILHLQCHFGKDTIRLKRSGARSATGLDFSPVAIENARALAGATGTDVTFVQGNLYDAPKLIDGKFDLVYVTWGTICWLPDIEEWARIVAHFLKPGGRFYFLDQHPVALSFDDLAPAPHAPVYDYFHKPEPITFDGSEAYADETAVLKTERSYEWTHPVGEVVTALIEAGLGIEYLHEFDTVAWKAFAYLVPCEGGLFRLPEGMPRLPLSYSISARKQD